MSTEAKKAPATEKGSAAEKRKEKGAPGNNGDSAPAKDLAATTPEIRRELLHSMMLQRRFEERCAEAYALGKIGGFCHLYIGQEAISTGVMSMIRPDDYVITAYRDHGQALARGVSPRAVKADRCTSSMRRRTSSVGTASSAVTCRSQRASASRSSIAAAIRCASASSEKRLSTSVLFMKL
jgi:TPP-dependent pyruvate/acetoin dehydrogenase alpha subunit